MLPVLYSLVKKLFYPPAVQAHQVVVVLAFVQLKHGFAAVKIAANQNTGLLKLGQHAVHRGQAYIRALFKQHAVHVFGAHVSLATALKNVQHFESR